MYLFCFNLWSSFSPLFLFSFPDLILPEKEDDGERWKMNQLKKIFLWSIMWKKWSGEDEWKMGTPSFQGKIYPIHEATWKCLRSIVTERRWKGSNTALGTICIYLGTPYTFQVGLKKAWAHWLPGELLALFDSCLPLEFRRVQCCLSGGGNMLLLLSMRSQKLSLRGFRIQMPEGCFDNNNTQSKKQQSRLGSKHNQASNNRTRG